ncbi:MAG: cadherin domain-containing protein [Ardenticatenaceae bacterium]|nr:cadherin domain-containing protein [Ardenticatenaceae bacterium]
MTKHIPTWFRALIMAASTLMLISLGAEATTTSQTNNEIGFADDNILTRTVAFSEGVDFAANSAIQDVNVAVNFEKIDGTCPTHAGGNAYNSEIFMFLESPAGTQVALVEDALNTAGSGTGTTYTGISYGGLAMVTFDDWAATTVGGLVPTSGAYKPVEALSAFHGEDPLGTWTLSVGDSAPSDPLCFYEFTLTIDAAQPPVADNQTFSVIEQSSNGTSVGTVVATDNDAGDKLTYTITAGNDTNIFAINKLTGEITVADGSQLDYETTPSYSLTVQVTDSSGLWDTATITINVTNTNEAPTDISLDNSSVLEHRPGGTAVGKFSTTDPDVGDSHTYSLVDGAGDTDNASFQISGSQLQTNAVFNYEAQSTYSIRVQTDDGNGGTYSKQFTITIIDGNDPPTDIDLDNASVAENQPSGTAVGTFTTIDPNNNGPYTYELVSGLGADDNASFTIGGVDGDQLQTAAVFDYETKSSYSIRVRSTDDGDLWFEKVFTITVTDANDAPTGISLDNSSVAENQSVGTAVGSFSTTDPDTGDSHTYSLVTGTGDTGNSSFQIVGSQLQTNAIFNYETQSSYSIRVQTDDGHGGMFEEVFTITIADANDAPTDISLGNSSVGESQPVGTAVGNFSTTDPDTGDSHTYSLLDNITYPDNDSFSISGGQLQTAVSFDFETKSVYTIQVQTNDGHGGTFSKEFTITITDGNDPPTEIALDNANVAENQVVGTAVGSFSSTDPNVSDTHTYSLVSGSGADDNTSFQIVNGELQTNAIFDVEVKSSYSIRVRSTDDGGFWFEEVFTITITDGNDAPTDISLSNSSVAENQPSGTAVGTFSSTDQDTGDIHTYALVSGDGDTGNGSFQISGTQLQTAASFNREVQSSYSIRVQTDDNHGGTFEKALTITVTNVNEGPTNIALSSSSVDENLNSGTAVGSLSTTDPDSGDTFTYSLVTGSGDADNSSFQISGSQLQTAVKFDFETKNSYSVRIQTRDSGGLTFEKAFSITINDANDKPVGVDDQETIDEDHVLNVAAAGVLANDTDQDNDTLTVMSADSSSAQGASVNVAADGGFTYDPTAVTALQALNVGEDIDDTFTYTVRDGGLIFDTATVTVTVTGVNDAPVAHNDNVTTVLETAALVSPLTNDTDPDTTDTKSLASFGQGTHGIVTDNHDGTLTYTPEAGYIGNDSFNYTVEDSHGASDVATVNVTVNPEIYYVYLPVALNNYTTAPDLVVTSLQASTDYVEVVIENQGSRATTSGFWVDFYVNPVPPPAAANELWPDLSNQGIAWGVTTSLAPGQELTLIYSLGGPNLYYSAQYSNFSGVLPVGTPVYAQVDSARVGSPNGAVEETHEILGSPYNNILQALATAVPITQPLTTGTAVAVPSAVLPTRH